MLKRLMKNISLLMVSQIISYVLLFVYTIITARYLGVTEFGTLSFALAFVTIITIFTDLGLNTVLTREISLQNSLEQRYINHIFSMKLILVFVVLILSSIYFLLMQYPLDTLYFIFIISLSVIFTTFSSFFYSIIQAHENLKYQAVGSVLSSSLLLIGILLVEYLNVNAIWVAISYLLVSVIVLLYILFFYSNNFILPKFEYNLNFNKLILKDSLQICLIGLFVTIYIWIDSMILFSIKGGFATGLYGVAYKIMLFFYFIPLAINYSIFPVISRLQSSNRLKLKQLLEKYFIFMIMISIPICIFITVLADKIIISLFGNGYLESILALQILIWSILFAFTASPFSELFIATKRQIIVTKITGLCMLGNVLLNLILIPKFSFIGASVATLLTYIAVGVLIIFLGYKYGYLTLEKSFLVKILKIFIANFMMAIFIWLFKSFNLIILSIISIIVYLAILYILGLINREEILNYSL